ncbi:MAG: archease [Gemmatimonadetes bacterium]|nr:MAG: archease [Gemmatimonadota bacterium]
MISYFDHTADVGLAVQANTLSALFTEAAEGMFRIIADLDTVEPRQSKKIQVSASTPVRLMVYWLEELLFLHETEQMLFCSFTINTICQTALTATIWGEPLDPQKHILNTEIKAVTYHNLHVGYNGAYWTAQIIFDL